MVIGLRGTLLVCLAVCFLGCSQSPPPPQPPFANLQLGMSFEDAKKLIGREGNPFDYDKLPVIPKPRALYKGIPEDTTWFVWWDEKTGAPMTLGILKGRVIYKEVNWDENGQSKGRRETLPEYQHGK